MKTKKLINDPADVVDEMIEGMLAAHPRHLRRAEGHRRALVAVEGPRTGKVGLVVGGGSGHEPTFAGLVGRGLADAVAIGNVFASPPPDPILACASAARGLDLQSCLAAGVLAAEHGAEATKGMVAGKGRAARLGERALGHMDPGAASAVVILKALATSL